MHVTNLLVPSRSAKNNPSHLQLRGNQTKGYSRTNSAPACVLMGHMHFVGLDGQTGMSGGKPVDLKLIYFNKQESPATLMASFSSRSINKMTFLFVTSL